MRPLCADFLREAAPQLDRRQHEAEAAQYGELGKRWFELADAALPREVPLFREVKKLLARIDGPLLRD